MHLLQDRSQNNKICERFIKYLSGWFWCRLEEMDPGRYGLQQGWDANSVIAVFFFNYLSGWFQILWLMWLSPCLMESHHEQSETPGPLLIWNGFHTPSINTSCWLGLFCWIYRPWRGMERSMSQISGEYCFGTC